jgi:site-specific DNA-methyltransferase (adenine-specific)
MTFKICNGDNLELIKEVADDSIDSIVTDPPYGISFMGKKWDYQIPKVELWEECLRVLKPGSHCLIACGTRTQHRMVVNIEDAGFQIRDVITWVYGTGFPKSLDISKAIDKAAGAERETTGQRFADNITSGNFHASNRGERRKIEIKEKPATEAAKKWNGWGTALKPASEFFTLVRKPIEKKTIAGNVLEWGTGGINVDGCRVGNDEIKTCGGNKFPGLYGEFKNCKESKHSGRVPANLIHDGSEEAITPIFEGSRFFYCAKASTDDRGKGNNHPTVKPNSLMRYLCRMITPPGGTVFDPFMGSGSTGKAAINEGFKFLGFELEKNFFNIALERLERASNENETTESGYSQKKFF